MDVWTLVCNDFNDDLDGETIEFYTEQEALDFCCNNGIDFSEITFDIMED